MIHKRTIILTIITLFLGALLWAATKSNYKPNLISKLKLLTEVFSIVEHYYVEDVDFEKLISGSIRGALDELDPHSTYIEAEEFEKIKEQFSGEFEGIGIEFRQLDGYITVISPIPGTPSDRAGLLSGDQIIKINGESAYKLKTDEIVSKLRGPKGTSVVVTIKRNRMDSFDVTLIRDKIPINSVLAAFIYDDNSSNQNGVGYIKLNRFASKTYKELISAIDSLEGLGMNKLVLDLRNNGGGLLDQGIQILDLFVSSNDTLLYTKGDKVGSQTFRATKNKLDKTFPIIVLLNRASASASEIVAGGLQDLDRGLVIGETSFGKGLVQRQFTLEDNSAARITVAKYYTPSGRLIQRDYNVGLDTYQNDLYTKNREVSDSLLSVLPQFKTKQGRTVYGGGGIAPDIYVQDNRTELLTKSSQDIIFHEERPTFKFANSIKHNFQAYPDFISFNNRYNQDIIKPSDFLAWIKQNNADLNRKIDSDSILVNWNFINNRIESDLASSIWGKDYYYYIQLSEDPVFQEAINAFKQYDALLK